MFFSEVASFNNNTITNITFQIGNPVIIFHFRCIYITKKKGSLTRNIISQTGITYSEITKTIADLTSMMGCLYEKSPLASLGHPIWVGPYQN